MSEHVILLRRFFYPRRGLLFLSMTFDLLANLTTIALPVLVSQAFAILLGFNSMRWKWLFNADKANGFQAILLITAGVLLLKTGLEFVRKRLHGRIGEDWSWWLRNQIFQHHLQLSLQHYEDRGIGRYLLRFSGDLSSAQNLVTKGILQFAADLSLLITGVVVVFLLDFMIGGIVAGALLILLTLIAGVNHLAGSAEVSRRNNKSELLAFVNLRLLNIASVKILNRETGEISQFERKSENIRQAGIRYARWKALADALIAFGVYAILLLVLWVTYVQQQYNPGVLSENTFAIMLLLLSLRGVFARAFQVGLLWRKGLISLKKITNLLALPLEPGRTLPEKMEYPNGALVFRDVSYYSSNHKILEHLSFTLAPGSIGLLHDATGAGRTVVTKLITGLYQPQSGDISLGNQRFSNLHIKDLRRSIAVVSGTAPLYGKTVLDAIANSRKPENREKAKVALTKWQLLFPILSGIMPHTRLRERSPQLTNVQEILLQFLRAKLTKKPFLVLDEPFQGLDETSRTTLLEQIQTDKDRKGILFLGASRTDFTNEKLSLDWVKSLD
ncbi:MAG: ABC transporter transmembrane domain-containing protein [Saprospiraceae bacterium]